MKKEAIDKFLLGTADDNQQRQCEELLANPETVVDCRSTVSDDSLLNALRTGDGEQVSSGSIRLLAEKIEQLVPRQAISPNELQRLLDPPMQPDDLGMIGRYRVIEFLASGGMGLVFRAFDPELSRAVCIKLLNPGQGLNAEAKSRFDREARAAARMSCERIMPVLEIGKQRDLPFLVMPMLEGTSLRTLLVREQRIAPDRAIQIARQIAEGLDYAHQRDVLHRDIKPDNLWITPTGDIKLLDFGLARTSDDMTPITKAGTVLGTPSYMSPEQVTGKPLDGRSDLFSVGVVLVEMLTGQSPFQKTNLFSTLMSVAGEEVSIDGLDPQGEIPQGLREVVRRLLKKNADERIGSAAELIGLLDQVQSSPQQTLTLPAKTSGNRWWKTIAAVLAGFAWCLGGLAIWNATDKGTLVVQANDPTVEVKIANERVTIHDPVSDRNYEIRIGETPLPSGVYQLETTDSTGDLVFSSQTITIRRGEKTIVTVELRAPNALAGQAEENPVLSANTPNTGLEDSTWTDPTRDESAYEAAGHKRIAEVINGLPALDLAATRIHVGPAISPEATVQFPKPLNNLASWSVEPGNQSSASLQSNCDGTRWCSVTDGFVQVHDRNGNMEALLPVPGQISNAQWDESNPDLIGVCSFVENTDSSETRLVNPYALFVWQVNAKGSRLIRKYNASFFSFDFDSGYRVAYFWNNQMQLARLDTGESWVVPGTTTETLGAGAISPDGRYIATYSVPSDRAQMSVWDLKKGGLLVAFADCVDIQWCNDNQRVAALIQERREQGEINESMQFWDLKSITMVREYSLGSARNVGRRPTISPDFSIMARSVKGGKIAFVDIETGRQSELEPPWSPNNQSNGYPELTWNERNELNIAFGSEAVTWKSNGVGLAGEFADLKPGTASASAKDNFNICWVDQKKESELSIIWSTGEPRRGASFHGSMYSTRADYKQFMQNVDLSTGQLSGALNLSGFDWLPPVNSNRPELSIEMPVSPDGKYVVLWGGPGRSDARVLQVVEIGNPSRTLVMGEFSSAAEICWSEDSRHVLIGGREHYSRGTRDIVKVFDVKEQAEIVIPELEHENIRAAVFWNGGFVFSVPYIEQETPRVVKDQLYFFDLSEDSKLVTIGDRCDYTLLDGVFDGKARVWMMQASAGNPDERSVFSLYELDDTLKLSKVTEADFNFNVRLSADGNLAFQQHPQNHYAPIKILPSNYSISKIRLEPGNETAGRVVHEWKGEIRNFQWHSVANAACWEEQERQVFWDETTGKMVSSGRSHTLIVPVADGWLAAKENSLFTYSLAGAIRGRMLFDSNDSGHAANPRWILADGSMQTDASREGLYMVYCRDNRVWCEPLSEFVANPENPKLPTFERVPFLTSD